MANKISLNCYGYLYGLLGYAIHSRNFFLALSKKIEVKTVSLFPNLDGERISRDLAALEQKGTSQIDFRSPALCIAYGNEMQKFCGSFRIGYPVFEFTRLPVDWVRQLTQLDQVWTPSRWSRQVLIDNGIAENKIRVVPEGVDPMVFNPQVIRYPQISGPSFKFLVTGKYEKRKAQEEVLRAYCAEFKAEDPVELLLLCSNIDDPAFKVREDISAVVQKPHPPITILNRFEDYTMLASLYRSCDVLVAPSRAEGWGLPIIESMACGIPVITTHYSGQTEFLQEEHPLLIKVDQLEDIHDERFFPQKGQYGKWAVISVDAIRQKMRWAFAHRAELKAIGEADSRRILQNWTWSNAADKAVQVLEKSLL